MRPNNLPKQPPLPHAEFARALAKVRKVTPAERCALYRWFYDWDVSDLLRMALRHGGRYLVINGGKH
jgi:hypothetical protein